MGRVALNIGGIANVTVIPAGAALEDIFAFDTGPGNMVIDALAEHLPQGETVTTFDRDRDRRRIRGGSCEQVAAEHVVRPMASLRCGCRGDESKRQGGDGDAHDFLSGHRQLLRSGTCALTTVPDRRQATVMPA